MLWVCRIFFDLDGFSLARSTRSPRGDESTTNSTCEQQQREQAAWFWVWLWALTTPPLPPPPLDNKAGSNWDSGMVRGIWVPDQCSAAWISTSRDINPATVTELTGKWFPKWWSFKAMSLQIRTKSCCQAVGSSVSLLPPTVTHFTKKLQRRSITNKWKHKLKASIRRGRLRCSGQSLIFKKVKSQRKALRKPWCHWEPARFPPATGHISLSTLLSGGWGWSKQGL